MIRTKAWRDNGDYKALVREPGNRLPEQADPVFDWAGWVYAVDAETGAWRWRVKSNYPVQSGVTPTAGVVLFGDMGGNF